MPSKPSTLRVLVRSLYRGSVLITALFLVLWIAFSGLIAVTRNPYLVPALWFLGITGLVSCVVACLSVLPPPGAPDRAPRPARATLFLGIGLAVAIIVWFQGRPQMEGSGPELAALGVFLVVAAVVGVCGLVILPLLVWALTSDEPEASVLATAE